MECCTRRRLRIRTRYVSKLLACSQTTTEWQSLCSLDNLLMRFEEPSSMVRWDSPLFTVPWTDADVPAAEIWKAVTEGNVKPPNAGTQAVSIPHLRDRH